MFSLLSSSHPQAEVNESVSVEEQKKRRTFKKFTYRGVDLDKILTLSPKELMDLVNVCLFTLPTPRVDLNDPPSFFNYFLFQSLVPCPQTFQQRFEEKAQRSHQENQGFRMSLCLYLCSICFLQKAKATEEERPEPVKTHLRDMIIVPDMIGGVVGVYDGKSFNNVEIKAEMLGRYLGEFSITYVSFLCVSSGQLPPRPPRSSRYWCLPLLPFHSSQVKTSIYFYSCDAKVDFMLLSLFSLHNTTLSLSFILFLFCQSRPIRCENRLCSPIFFSILTTPHFFVVLFLSSFIRSPYPTTLA